MAKNDYYVMAYKLLTYLYNCLKKEQKPNMNYLKHETKYFPVGEEYFRYLIEHMAADGYVENVVVLYADDSAIVSFDESIRISPKGIEYLDANSMMKKAERAIKDISDMIP